MNYFLEKYDNYTYYITQITLIFLVSKLQV